MEPENAGSKQIIRFTPICEITGNERTANTLQQRLISCSVVDASGLESDSISIQIDASGLRDWPSTGQLIGCRMGYKEDESIMDLGQFHISRITENLLPNTLTITGTTAPFHKDDPTGIKKARSKTWFGKTVGDIVREIAQNHGYSPRIHSKLDGFPDKNIPTFHIDQTNETDLAFLTRLAEKYGAVCKPVGSLLVFSLKGEVKSLTGQTLEPVVIEHPSENHPGINSYISGSITSADKRMFKGVIAHWYFDNGVQAIKEEEGESPYKQLTDRYDSQDAAKAAIKSEMFRIKRQGDKLSLECPGDPMLNAEGLLKLENFPSIRAEGNWSIDRVTHNFSGDYRCSVEATRPL